MYLGSQRVEAQHVSSGDEAIALVDVWQPHVEILDITMPFRDGYSTAAALRQSAHGSELNILAFTALDETLVKGRAVGFDAYCRKGASVSALFAFIHLLADVHGPGMSSEDQG